MSGVWNDFPAPAVNNTMVPGSSEAGTNVPRVIRPKIHTARNPTHTCVCPPPIDVRFPAISVEAQHCLPYAYRLPMPRPREQLFSQRDVFL